MENYKGFSCDQYGTVYNEDGYAVGKLNGDLLKEWVDDYEEGLCLGIYS